MKHVFSESADIARKNKRNLGYRPNLTNYIRPNIPKPQLNNSSMKKFIEYTHCRECLCVLENRYSKIWGICPSCDNK